MKLGEWPGRRLCAKLWLHGLRTALLGQLIPAVLPQAPRVLGVDEFACGEDVPPTPRSRTHGGRSWQAGIMGVRL
ncbi:hypothetical protein GCM10010094_72560 [Streptomyces flaveus]|uniref:Transposase n=1 Tax=Streptomyces flaveus TaxID=66370 RepID=A0A917RDY7_9ACTN|nr:hypothetical protein GCM10010094_72560 [Streptomyces flaveus]